MVRILLTLISYLVSGDNDDKETPVPMPNTEVKLIMPKILAGYPAGKIGRCQALYILQ